MAESASYKRCDSEVSSKRLAGCWFCLNAYDSCDVAATGCSQRLRSGRLPKAGGLPLVGCGDAAPVGAVSMAGRLGATRGSGCFGISTAAPHLLTASWRA